MNPDLAHALTQFVNHATTLLDAGTAQLPAVLNDIIAYQLFDARFAVWLGIGLLPVGVVGWLVMASSDGYDWAEPLGFITGIGGTIGGLLFLTRGIDHVYYVTYFPRLVILDYLKGLL